MADLVGLTLKDRYFLRKKVGAGGMADVYMAWDKVRSTTMAVKVLHRDLVHNPRFFRHFTQEAELLRRLEHPYIVRLYEFERDGDIVFLVMDWVDGSDLRRALEVRKRPFTLEEVSRILTSVSSALHFAHQQGVYHCDVKPANILLHQDGRVLITDFGVARFAQAQGVGGTPPYMAPEQIRGDTVDARTDVYALGITLYELLSGGKLPFMGKSPASQGSTTKERILWEHLNLPPPPLRRWNPGIPESVEQVVFTALQKDPDARFPSVVALRDAFEHARMKPAGGSIRTSIASTQMEPGFSRPEEPSRGSLRETFLQQVSTLRDRFRSTPAVPRRPRTSPKGPYLVVRRGEQAGQVIPLSQGEITLGRSHQNQVQFRDRSVSRRHASLICTRQGVYLRDEGSSVGTFVNGRRIPPGAPVRLEPGDVIRLGYGVVLEYREERAAS